MGFKREAEIKQKGGLATIEAKVRLGSTCVPRGGYRKDGGIPERRRRLLIGGGYCHEHDGESNGDMPGYG